MRGIIILVILVFVLTLTTTIGLRVRTEGKAFLLGLGCGLAASFPASALAFYLTQRYRIEDMPLQQRHQAPLVIVTGTPPQPTPPLPDYPPLTSEGVTTAKQPYRIIGEEGE